jgi:hypothetical protein
MFGKEPEDLIGKNAWVIFPTPLYHKVYYKNDEIKKKNYLKIIMYHGTFGSIV